MFCIIDICCLCLKTNNALNSLRDIDDNLTYYKKMSTIFPDLLPESDELKICPKCCKDINLTYAFRKSCVKNLKLYKTYTSNLRSVGIKTGVISVSLDDIVKNTQLRPGTKVYARTDQGNHIKLFDYRTKVDSVDKTSEHLKAIEFSDCCENEIQSRDDTDGEEEKIEVKLENSSFEAVYIRDLSEILRSPEMDTFRSETHSVSQTEKLNCNLEVLQDQGSENITNIKISDQNKIFEQVGDFDEIKLEEIAIKVEPLNDENTQKDILDFNEDFEGDPSFKNMETPNSKRRSKCTFTEGKTVSNQEGDMAAHNADKFYPCTECDRAFSNADVLKRHGVATHGIKKSYVCTECNKSFRWPSHLNLHVRIHTEEKPFECVECKKAFSQSSNLKEHMRCHSGETPYKCIECNRGFKWTSHLKLHMRTHSGEKPFKCKKCGRAFNQGSNLTTHLRNIHGIEKS